jgi:cysteine desulfurase
MSKSNIIYMDYASSSLQAEANPSAIHELGVKEKAKLEQSKKTIAGILGAHADEIIFTSGATESNNLAILGTSFGKIITTNIEHASVLETAKHRAHTIFIAVEKNGIIDPQKIKKTLRPDTVLVSVMYANNEIGTIQPIREIGKVIRHYNKLHNKKIIFHTDATQAMNYLPINAEKLGVDMLSFNAAKVYGPKGVGVLYKKRNVKLAPIMYGGDQEHGLRPGTENVAGALALSRALQGVEKIKDQETKRLTKLRDYFISKLPKNIILNGDKLLRLPNNINITIPNIPSDLIVLELSARGIMLSAKSACKSGDGKASHVIKAINPKLKETDGSLRFSLGRETTKKDIDTTLKALTQILTKYKMWYY